MSVSNKTLSVLLLAAIVVSLGGTFVSLNRLGSMTPTGYTTFNETGTVALLVDDNLAIELFPDPANMNFGTCTLIDGTQGYTVNTDSSGSHENSRCDGAPTGIDVRNVGNIIANVRLEVNDTDTIRGGNFMNISTSGADSTFEYRTVNLNGCGTGTLEPDYTEFVDTTTLHTGCSVLQTGANNDFRTHFQVGIPDNARGQSSVTITFVAMEAT